METDEVQDFLRRIREEHGRIVAHPMMYVSALHNRQGSYPVDQNDSFFQANEIEFLELPTLEIDPDDMEPPVKYVVTIDESGAYRHEIKQNS